MNLPIFIIAFVILFAIELIYLFIAKKYQIIDAPNERSSHSIITIRGGGIIFPIAAFSNLVFIETSPFGFYFGLAMVTIICFWDDIKPAKISIRFALQIIATIALFYQANTIPILMLILLGIYSIALMNAFNFMDGINGITVSYGLVIICTLFYINIYETQFINNEIFTMLIASLLVFSYFNFRVKAICFAGDVGSVVLAFIVTHFIFLLIDKSKNYNYLFFVMVYGVDTFVTIIFRIINKEKLHMGHKNHLFQILKNEGGINPLTISMLYASLQLLINIIIIISGKFSIIVQSFIIVFILSCLILIYLHFRNKYRVHYQK